MISVQHLSFSYSHTEILLDNFHLEVPQGSLFGLLGPNGAGKTTLISLIAGQLKPGRGVIDVNGMRYQQDANSIYNSISVVPQEYAFYQQMTVAENLDFFSRMYHGIESRRNNIERALQLTGLEQHQQRRAGQFSGGLKRRLNLAIGLLNNPDLLILDEPTTGIDPQSRQFILQAIKQLNANGMTVLYTSHYMDEIEQICDQVAIMDHGRLLVNDSLTNLLSAQRLVAIELLDRPVDLHQHAEIDKFLTDKNLQVAGNRIKGCLEAQGDLYRLLELLKKHAIEIASVHYARQSLESLFFELTHRHLRDN